MENVIISSGSLASSKKGTDGGPSEYYDFPEGAVTLNDLIEGKNMSFAQGNIFKAAYRMGTKDGISLEYDIRKIIYYANRMLDTVQKSKQTTGEGWDLTRTTIYVHKTPPCAAHDSFSYTKSEE